MKAFNARVHLLLNEAMKSQGATAARSKLLLFIDGRDTVRSTDITRTLGLAPRTVTEALDALERDGYIRRETVENDRRVRNLILTDAGKAVVKQIEPLREIWLQRIFGVLAEEERDELSRLLNKLNDNLADMPVTPFETLDPGYAISRSALDQVKST
ncbi:MAG TPA: MarR family winged helix-turn-helix transcriptional regulator [Sphingobium sp.]